MTDAEILEKLREYFQTKVNNLSGGEMAEGPFEDPDETLETFGDAWEAAAKVIDRRGGLRIRFEFGDTDPALTAAAQQREERAEAEARPHDDEQADGAIVYVVEGEGIGAVYAATSDAGARDWVKTFGAEQYPSGLSVTALAVER